MEYAVKSGSPEKQRTPCVVVGVFDSRRMSDAAKAMEFEKAAALRDQLIELRGIEEIAKLKA